MPLRFDFMLEKLKRRKAPKLVVGTGKVQQEPDPTSQANVKPQLNETSQSDIKRRKTG